MGTYEAFMAAARKAHAGNQPDHAHRLLELAQEASRAQDDTTETDSVAPRQPVNALPGLAPVLGMVANDLVWGN